MNTSTGNQEKIMSSHEYQEGKSITSADAMHILNNSRSRTENVTRTRAAQVLNDMVQNGKLMKDGNGSWKRRCPTEGNMTTAWRTRYYDWEGQYTPNYY